MSVRSVAHLDLDSFYVSVERLRNSKLVGIPVIIGWDSERGVVASCSYEARAFGVRSAMPVKKAKQLCPKAIIVRGDMNIYSHYSHMVTDIIAEKAPLWEKASIDEHYIDITGLDKFYGNFKWTKELKEFIIKNTGLPISFGLSVNKTVAKIATNEIKPSGELYIEAGRVNEFLDPMPVKKIPMLGKHTCELLNSKGIYDIKTLRLTHVAFLEKMLGKNGRILWEKANGIDETPVLSNHERKSISTEITFEYDIDDIGKINSLLSGMVEKLAYRLRKNKFLTSCVAVKIRYSDFETATFQKQVPYTAFDHILTPAVKDIFEKSYRKNNLIRLIGVKFTNLVHGEPQLNLFEDTQEMLSLYKSLDDIKDKFGEDIISRSASKTEWKRGEDS
ncbi:MAG: DNA polymerase IV [Bacteroidales bacterium]|jgi:DNA polymerase-4|nr:DNA polymerase IV [Bacteroidales bacterium]